MQLTENTIVTLPNFKLPSDYAVRVGLVAMIESHIEANENLPPLPRLPRFTGYYFRQKLPVGICSVYKVTLVNEAPICHLPSHVREAVGPFCIASSELQVDPLYMLVHDTLYGTCWLQRFEYAQKFIHAVDPVIISAPNGLD